METNERTEVDLAEVSWVERRLHLYDTTRRAGVGMAVLAVVMLALDSALMVVWAMR
jgi:hypothetical protein